MINIKEIIDKCDAVIAVKGVDFRELAKDPALNSYWNDIKTTKKGLLDISHVLYTEYTEYNKSKRSKLKWEKWKIWKIWKEWKELKDFVTQYEIVIECIFSLLLAFDLNKNIERVNDIQIHIDQLRNQCNILIYKKQQIELKTNFWIAIIALIISSFLSSHSICLTRQYGESGAKQAISTDTILYQLFENTKCCCPEDTITLPTVQESKDNNSDEKPNKPRNISNSNDTNDIKK